MDSRNLNHQQQPVQHDRVSAVDELRQELAQKELKRLELLNKSAERCATKNSLENGILDLKEK